MMKNSNFKTKSFLIVSLFLLALGIFGNEQQKSRYKAPFISSDNLGNVVVTELLSDLAGEPGSLKNGDVILKLNGIPVASKQYMEFLFDTNAWGASEAVYVSFRRGSETFSTQIVPVLRYGKHSIILNLFLGASFWLIGVFVYLRKREEIAAKIFVWVCMSLTVMIMTIWPRYPGVILSFNYLFSAAFFLIYLFVPALIFYFSILYPQSKPIVEKFKFFRYAIFLPSVIFFIILEVIYFLTIQSKTLIYFDRFTSIYYWFRLYYIFYLLLSLFSMVHSFLTASGRENRNKILWILWGLFFGATPFLFLWSVPQILGFSPWVPQEFNYILLILTPLTVGFSIVRYQVFDIEVLINRSIVYTILTGIIIGLYLLLVGLTGRTLFVGLSQDSGTYLIILFTLFAAIVFSPMKKRVQTFVDKTFYRIKYDYRLAIQEFGRSLVNANNEDEVLSSLIDTIDFAIPMKKIAVVLNEISTIIPNVVKSRGLVSPEKNSIDSGLLGDFLNFTEMKRAPIAKIGRIETSSFDTFSSDSIIEKMGFELVFPITMHNQFVGYAALGQKKSEARYFEEDIQLLTQMIEETTRALERIELQKIMIFERAAKEKLEELNQLKSEFISHVSHELRTPLTSICWSVENMLDGIPESPGPKTREYLEGVHDCTQHLQRMIENLLDITKIEAGKIDIFPVELHLESEIQKSVEISRHIAKNKQIQCEVNVDSEILVRADEDSLRAILMNLLENAVKYSESGSRIQIKAELKKNDSEQQAPGHQSFVVISVIDEGAGIPREKHAAIFDRFERIQHSAGNQKGLGLGLFIVKKLVELQGGKIWVTSEKGRGSVFSFTLPTENKGTEHES